MFSRDFFLRSFGGVLVALAVLFVAPSIGAAQEEEETEAAGDEDASEETDDETAATAPASGRNGSGAPVESWIAMAVALGVGAATIAVGGIIGRLALDQNAIALDPRSTQLVANSTHHTASDYALVSTVLLTVGGVMAGIGAVWAIVLPFSTPPGVAVHATITPTSIGLSGTF
jgi:hypothetical protein